MDNSRVLILNVNPAEATMGSLHPEAAINRMRRKMDLEGASLARKKSGGMLRAFFGSTSLSPARSGMLLTLRVLFGAFMVYFGYMSLEGSVILAVASALFGLLLVAGFLTRFSMIASALTFGILSGMAFEAGQMPETTLLIAVMSIGMAFLIISNNNLIIRNQRGINNFIGIILTSNGCPPLRGGRLFV